jgi:hypothetical protein
MVLIDLWSSLYTSGKPRFVRILRVKLRAQKFKLRENLPDFQLIY